jgi:hypothetical protein
MSTAQPCGCNATTGASSSAAPASDTLEVQFLGVEMSAATGTKSCSSCDTARSRLDAAIDAVRPVLDAVGVSVAVSELFVETELEARALRLTGSPTIRVGGVELKPEHRGRGEDGRVWTWNGEEHPLPPQAMLVDAILRGYALQRDNAGIGALQFPPYMGQYLKPEKRSCECV